MGRFFSRDWEIPVSAYITTGYSEPVVAVSHSSSVLSRGDRPGRGGRPMGRGTDNNRRRVRLARGGWPDTTVHRVVEDDSDDDAKGCSTEESDRLSQVTMTPAQVAAYPYGDSDDDGKAVVRFPPSACVREKDKNPKALRAGLLGSKSIQEATSAARPVNEIFGVRSRNGGEAVIKTKRNEEEKRLETEKKERRKKLIADLEAKEAERKALRRTPSRSRVVATDGGMALGDNEKVVARSADGESNGSSSSDVVRGAPGSDLDETIPLIAPVPLGCVPTGATLRSEYERLGRREDVKLSTDEAELLPRALEPNTYDFLLSNDDELISVRVGSNDTRPVKLVKRLYGSLDTSRLDHCFIPLRRFVFEVCLHAAGQGTT